MSQSLPYNSLLSGKSVKKALELENIGVWAYDPEEQEVEICPISASILQAKSGQLKFSEFLDILSDVAEISSFEQVMERADTLETGFEIELPLRNVQKNVASVIIKASPITNSSNSPGLIGTIKRTELTFQNDPEHTGLRKLLENASIPYIVINNNLAILTSNQSFRDSFSPRTDTLLDIVAEDHHKTLLSNARQMLESGNSSLSKFPLSASDGSVLNCQLNFIPTKSVNSNGTLFCLITPTAEPNGIKKKLKEERRLLESIISNLPTLFFLFDENGKFFRWNDNLERVTGYSGEEVAEMHPVQFFDEDQVDRIADAILEVFTEGTATVESEVFTKSGEKIPYFFFAARLEYEDRTCLAGYGLDMSSKKEMEREILNSERRFKSLVQDGGDLIAILDENANYQYISPTAERVLGINTDDYIKKNALKYVHYEDQRRVYDAIKMLPPKEQIQLKPYRYVDAEGNWRWLETVLTNLTEEPSVSGYIANSRDITDKKELENTIYKEKKLLDQIISNIPMIFFIFNAEAKPLRWNDELLRVTGYNEEEAAALSPLDYFDEDQLPQVIEIIQHTFTNGYATVETEILTKNGKKIPYFFFGAKIRYNDEDCLVGYGVDITDRKEAERKIQESEKRFKNLVQDGQDLLAIIDNEGNYKYVSPSSETVLGFPPEIFEGKSAFDFIPQDDTTELKPILENLKPGDRISVGPYRFRDSDGNWRWLETILTNLEHEPSINGLVANTKDITKIKEQEEKLVASLEEKEVLLAEIHHRVKNNLAVVSGMIQMQALDEEDDNVEEKLMDSVFRIQAMANIHELLYQSSSFSQLTYTEIIHKLVNGIKNALQGDRNIRIEFDTPEFELNVNQAIPFSLILNEVITNIYKHAFRGKKEGTIKICSELTDEQVHLIVRDDGVGLPDDFNIQTSNSLGLNIINILARQIEAEHSLTSDKTGTTFSISFKRMNIRGAGSGLISDETF